MRRSHIVALLVSACFSPVTPALAQQVPGATEPATQPATAASAAAQSEAEPAPQDSGEIVVTASKRNERLVNVPQAVTAITSETLHRENILRFEDFATKVPGLSFVSERAGITQIALRGITTGDSQPNASVGTYLDETPLNSSTIFSSGNLLTPDIDTSDLTRIEVLRGPQGTLYGANTIGGILKYVSTPPDLERFGGRVELIGDTAKSGELGYSARVTGNVPIVRGAVALRVNLFDRRDPGYVDDPANHRADLGRNQVRGGRASLLVVPTSSLSVRLSAFTQTIDGKGYPSIDVIVPSFDSLAGGVTQNRKAAENVKVTNHILNGTVNWKVGSAELVSSTSYNTARAGGTQDYSFQVAPLAALLPPLASGAGLANSLRQNKFTEEVRLQSSAAARPLEWRIGGFYTLEHGTRIQNIEPLVTLPLQLYVVDFASRYRELAAFGDLTVHFTQQFDLTGGLRYSHNNQQFNETGSGALLGGSVTANENSSDSTMTWLINPRWRPSDSFMVYARAASGYRPGGPNVISPASLGQVPTTFAPDRLINYESGVKGELLDRTFTYDIAGFYIDWRDVQIVCSVGGLTYECNGGRAKSQGIEWQFAYDTRTGLTLGLNGAYTDAVLTEDAPAIGGRKGDRLPYVPRLGGSMTVDYSHKINADWSISAGATLRYTGDRFTAFGAGSPIKLPAYTQVDLRMGASDDHYSISLFARNIGNARGITSATLERSLTATTSEYSVGIIQPRTIGLSLAANFW